MAGERQIGQHLHPACAVEFDGRLAGQIPAQGAGRDPGRPHLACRFDAPDGAVGVLDGDAVAVDVGHHRPELDFDAHLFQPRGGSLAELVAERRQHRGGGVEQDDPCPGGVDVTEGALQGVIGQFRDLAGHLDAGGPGADDGEREQLFPAAPDRLDRSAASNALRMRPRSSSASSMGLHARREFGELVVAEVGLPGPGRDDQAVVGGFVAMTQEIRHNDFAAQVDMCHVTEEHLDVALSAQDDADGRCISPSEMMPVETDTRAAETGDGSCERST